MGRARFWKRSVVSAPSANILYREAQRLIKTGQPVFPCKSVGEKAKAPMTKNGLYDATLDVQQVKRWWSQHRTAAIGIPTGIIWDVLDVDVKRDQDGRVHLPYLQRLGLLNGCQWVARTPSGGWHLYFKAAHGLSNTANAYLGLDLRAKGGYVVAPPSYIDMRGTEADYEGSYEDMGATTGATNDPLLWDLLVSAIRPIDITTKKPIVLLPSERRASLASLREWVANIKPGERNNGLHWAVCRCIDNNIDPHELVEPALLAGLGEDEVSKTINSALQRAGLVADEMDSEAEAMFPDPV